MRFLTLMMSLIAVAAHAADDYVGSWHNQKDGFNTMGFALRKDGRGIFATAIFPVLLRWERTDTGILLKIADQGRTTEMRLTYDAATKTFIYGESGNERQIFWQISTDEPPDVEAQMEERRLKEQEAVPASIEDKKEFSSRDALLQGIQSWAERTPPNAHGLTAFVRASDSSWQFTLRNFGGHYFIDVPVTQKSIDKLTPGLGYSPVESTTEPDLPTHFSLPKPHIEALRKWLTDHGIAFSELAYEARGPWQVEGYYTTININLKSDRNSLYSIARYLINELFNNTKPPYLFSTLERKDG